MTRLGIEPQSRGPLAYTQLISPMARTSMYNVFLSNTNNLQTILWFQVFLYNTNNDMI